jgi:hypothetical protein
LDKIFDVVDGDLASEGGILDLDFFLFGLSWHPDFVGPPGRTWCDELLMRLQRPDTIVELLSKRFYQRLEYHLLYQNLVNPIFM